MKPLWATQRAFKFRTEFDKTASCQPAVAYGSITLAQTTEGGSRAMIEYSGQTFPLPMRDPRRQVEITQAGHVVDPSTAKGPIRIRRA